ncbi:hypothetical protein BB560_002215 [Smittium megazygosporum]|uniref:BRCT domain-containing protein n=1 Tax=Smittium megazygosporum TaxID=133381 RepID=A0A2T9ZFF6_9FUNG|nr:hypothetical protein BB560_002215 [Smittium megazygosporum]
MQLLSSYTKPNSSKVQFTIGKIDAGMAVLLTNENQQIEFPSILLPQKVGVGSVVSVNVFKDVDEEAERSVRFDELQEAIYKIYGTNEPDPPVLKMRSITQTFVALEWAPLNLYQSDYKKLVLLKDNARLPIVLPNTLNSANSHPFVKVSGLDVDHEYTFKLVLETSSGVYESNDLVVRTRTLDNLKGICVCFGNFESAFVAQNSNEESDQAEGSKRKENPQIAKLKRTIDRIGAKWTEKITVDVTHLVCTIPGGLNYELASVYNIPVVKPEWLYTCESEKKLQPSLNYYLS